MPSNVEYHSHKQRFFFLYLLLLFTTTTLFSQCIIQNLQKPRKTSKFTLQIFFTNDRSVAGIEITFRLTLAKFYSTALNTIQGRKNRITESIQCHYQWSWTCCRDPISWGKGEHCSRAGSSRNLLRFYS